MLRNFCSDVSHAVPCHLEALSFFCGEERPSLFSWSNSRRFLNTQPRACNLSLDPISKLSRFERRPLFHVSNIDTFYSLITSRWKIEDSNYIFGKSLLEKRLLFHQDAKYFTKYRISDIFVRDEYAYCDRNEARKFDFAMKCYLTKPRRVFFSCLFLQ